MNEPETLMFPSGLTGTVVATDEQTGVMTVAVTKGSVRHVVELSVFDAERLRTAASENTE